MNANAKPLSLRVLVVDDLVDAADSTALLIRAEGHEARVAYEAEAGLRLAQEYVPDVVLLDIGLPGVNGWQAARRLRELPGLDRALVVAVTGFSQPSDFRRSYEAGFSQHLVKPLDPDQLSDLLTDHGQALVHEARQAGL
jgi:two-component system CheB/CheR fusion protein